jgi:hypothetical protein
VAIGPCGTAQSGTRSGILSSLAVMAGNVSARIMEDDDKSTVRFIPSNHVKNAPPVLPAE